MLKTIEKSYKKRLTVWGVVTSREIDYDPEELKRQLASGLKPRQIAVNFDVCEATLTKWRKAHGCPIRARKRQITPELFQVFEELYKQGYTDAKIAHETTYNRYTVICWRTAREYPKNKTPTRIIFERMYSEGCRNYIMLSEATGLSASTMRIWTDKETQREASKAEDPRVYYRKAWAELKEMNSNGVHRDFEIRPEIEYDTYTRTYEEWKQRYDSIHNSRER